MRAYGVYFHHQTFFVFPLTCRSEDIIMLTSRGAKDYRFPVNGSAYGIGYEDMYNFLLRAGAVPNDEFTKGTIVLLFFFCDVTIDWVANHYKWIVWKLACTIAPNLLSLPQLLKVLLGGSRMLSEMHRSSRPKEYFVCFCVISTQP